jgi:hypothetical protein
MAKFPDAERMENFARIIHKCEPEVDDVIGFMDDLSLLSECTLEVLEQNATYNGYYSDTMVNNIIAYGPVRKVFFCAINFPGSWHRSGDAALILVGHISCRQA